MTATTRLTTLTTHKPVANLCEVESVVEVCQQEERKLQEYNSSTAHEQQKLVERAIEGDQQAFSRIVDQYGPLMLRTASLIVGDQDVAQDIVQDAFILAWHHLTSLRNSEALRPWLMRIVMNQSVSFRRRQARSAAFVRQALSEQEIEDAARSAEYDKGSLELTWDLAQAIESLPIKQKIVIILHYYNGMTLPEMGQALATSENTLKKRIQAALANLRRILCLTDGCKNIYEWGSPMLLPARNVRCQ